MKNIIIIGAGLSGYLVVINLFRFYKAGTLKVTLLEKDNLARLGLAYSTDDDDHLLNVPAERMSAFPDEPDHFLQWLRVNSHNYSVSSFVPRRIYRFYILDLYQQLNAAKASGIEVQVIREEALDVNMENKFVITSSGTIQFDQLVMATGNLMTRYLQLQDQTYLQSRSYYHSSWDKSWASQLKGNESILIIGTGLSMSDTLLTLQKTGHQGGVVALSRHGLLPVTHLRCDPYPNFAEDMQGVNTALGMFQVVRFHLKRASDLGYDWRAVIDVLRQDTQVFWHQLPNAERRCFLEHLRHYWDVCRHRSPQTCANKLEQILAENKLIIIAGRILQIEILDNGKYSIDILKKGEKEIQQLTTDIIINCMGPATNYNLPTEIFFKNLIKRKLVIADTLGLGLLCTEDGALIGGNGHAWDCFHTLGTPRIGQLWETTAAPEIRVQAQQLASKLLEPVNQVKVVED